MNRSGVDFDDADSGYKEEDKDSHKVAYTSHAFAPTNESRNKMKTS
jgi:hypothetical protein